MDTPNYNSLLQNIRRYSLLTKEEEARILAIVQVKRVKRRQFIVQPGFVCQHRTYIAQGAFRVYHLDPEGKEHTVSIGIEDWFVSDFYSYIHQVPATYYIEALEDALVFQLAYRDVEPLCREMHGLSEFFRKTTEKAFAYARQRVIANISQTAEERYKSFCTRYPIVVQRVPQYVVASYLGMSAEFLSKIRARQNKKS